jgi:hypothetical protein
MDCHCGLENCTAIGMVLTYTFYHLWCDRRVEAEPFIVLIVRLLRRRLGLH